MPCIKTIATALPKISYNPDVICEIGDRWLANQEKSKELFKRLVKATNAQARHFVVDSEQVLNLAGLKRRQDIFEHFAPELGAQAMALALEQSGTHANELGSLIFTSCSCPSIPAIDGLIIDRLNLPRSTPRLPIYQHGCAAGVIGLELATDLAKTRGTVALTAVELCSLVFNSHCPSAAELVGSSIFADGAACAIISQEERGLCFRGSQSYLVPNSRHLMGYETQDDGYHLRLDRELPQALSSVAPQQVKQFLEKYGLKQNQIAHWLFHPGGIKILDFLETTFSLQPQQAIWSRNILKSLGNMSSATILFVLQDYINSNVAKTGDLAIVIGVGPGLTVELILLEWR